MATIKRIASVAVFGGVGAILGITMAVNAVADYIELSAPPIVSAEPYSRYTRELVERAEQTRAKHEFRLSVNPSANSDAPAQPTNGLSVSVRANRDANSPSPLQAGDNSGQLLKNPQNPQVAGVWTQVVFTGNAQDVGRNE